MGLDLWDQVQHLERVIKERDALIRKQGHAMTGLRNKILGLERRVGASERQPMARDGRL